MTRRRLTSLAAAWLGAAVAVQAQRRKKKKDEELPTQTLELPKELPAALLVEPGRLIFHAVPLSSRGLLSQQVREAVRTLFSLTKGAAPVRLRALVSGTGDLRRVPAIVSEEFTQRRMPLPVLTVVQVGPLPTEGAQVALEAMSMEKRTVNPHGVAFIGIRGASSDNPLDPLVPLAEKTIEEMRRAANGAEIISLTCFASMLDQQAQSKLRAAFPKAAFHYVQTLRAPTRAFVRCEAVARFDKPAEAGAAAAGNVALVSAPWIAVSGGQVGFHNSEADIRLAFQRLEKSLAAAQSTLKRAVYLRDYVLTRGFAERIHGVEKQFLNGARLPAVSEIQVEGLPGLDATFGLDVVAVAER